MKIFMILLCCSFYSVTIFGACMGGVPVWGTGDDRESCAIKQNLKKEEQQLNIQEKKKELELKRRGIENSGTGAGTGNTNVILGGINDLIGGGNDNVEMAQAMPFSQHQLRIELMPYVIPGAYQFDEPGMPKGYSFGVAWEYYLNRNLGLGLVMQQWEKSGGRGFDPIMSEQRDGSGDTAVFFPGAIDSLRYTSYIAYASINAAISESWNSILRLGVGRTQIDVKYEDIDYAKHPYAHQPDDNTYTDTASLIAGLAIEHIASTGTRLGGEIRYHNARNDTDDYTEYLNMGSVQVVFYVQFMLTPLGLL